jgi:hypothetical protein
MHVLCVHVTKRHVTKRHVTKRHVTKRPQCACQAFADVLELNKHENQDKLEPESKRKY